MFPHRFFPARHFAPRYFPPVPAGVVPPAYEPGGGTGGRSGPSQPQYMRWPKEDDDDVIIGLIITLTEQ